MLVALLALDKPLQAHFGELDNYEHFSDPAAADQLERQIRPAPGIREVFRYPAVRCIRRSHQRTTQCLDPKLTNHAASSEILVRAQVDWQHLSFGQH